MQEHTGVRVGQEAGRWGASGREAEALDTREGEVEQWVDGVLHVMPRPATPHSVAHTHLVKALGDPDDPDGNGDSGSSGGAGGWWILIEPEVQCGDNLLVPDLAGWRKTRMPEPLDQPIDLAPDWVCEVLSPSTRRLDLGRKREIYAETGVQWLWFVDPAARTLEAFALQDGAWQPIASLAGDALVSVPPFAAVSFRLDYLWTRIGRRAHTIHEPPPPPYVVDRGAAAG